ncbi:hypothetical protein DTL21_07480 [Bremerella cremea]|uniref:SPOR domain-containing protein n=1 Tax=Blastopirellula marina TaxID=124 RepID=A0A2S8G002_9BACT|nr:MULTISPECIES: hypothetical protein [Pirellulaceae]PQO37777.1 hypothetical protein C5Y83_07480 [Blastopirellula marina]RCS50164.1 hypothetical protein DTL21_07480 [Bremerella cremea]
MKRITSLLLVAVAFAAITSQVSAKDLKLGPIQIDIPGWCPPNPGQGERPATRYRVTLYHPLSGGVVWSSIATSRADADRIANNYRRQHWKIWKYNGIGEPTHSKQFGSYSAADRYKPKFKILGINKQYVRAGRVSMQRI